MLSALAIVLLAQMPCGPEGPIMCATSRYAFFEFAPTSGAGMGTACACTTPSGVKGEVMTFVRASSGTCLKGNTTTGVANGDMVTCSTNQPRVMPGGDGTGALGLLAEAARTNVVLRSQELDNAAWTLTASGVANPTVTADQAVAPDGTTTAERVQIPATSGVQFSLVASGNVLVGTTVSSVAIFVKGNGTSGQTCLAAANGSSGNCLCNYVASSWTRCLCENKTLGGSSGPLYFGNYSGVGGGACNAVSFTAQDVFVWGAHGETSGAPYVTSYIATTSASVTRATEIAYLSLTWSPPATFSLAATSVFTPLSGWATQPIVAMAYDDVGAKYATSEISTAGTRTVTECTNPPCSAGTYSGSDITIAASQVRRTATFHTGTLINACIGVGGGGSCNNGRADTFAQPSFTRTYIGGWITGGTQMLDGVVKQVCADPSPTRCR